MSTILGVALRLGVMYGVWGLITVCDPHLVSEEKAKDNAILSSIKGATDLLFLGSKVMFLAPFVMVRELRKEIKKAEAA